jgi:hypothetical protein
MDFLAGYVEASLREIHWIDTEILVEKLNLFHNQIPSLQRECLPSTRVVKANLSFHGSIRRKSHSAM